MGVLERYRALDGKWKYAQNRKLRKAIKRAEFLKMMFILGGDYNGWKYGCGTQLPSCPFRYRPSGEDTTFMPLCLVNSSKERPAVIGCYIIDPCRRGQEVWLRLRAWSRRATIR